MNSRNPSLRTALGKVRGLGAARSGTEHFWKQRWTAVASIPLTIGFLIIAMLLMGRNHAAVVQILGSPLVAIVMLLFITINVYHMWLGMQTIIEDYVAGDVGKLALLMANLFFCGAIGLTSVFAILQLSFGV